MAKWLATKHRQLCGERGICRKMGGLKFRSHNLSELDPPDTSLSERFRVWGYTEGSRCHRASTPVKSCGGESGSESESVSDPTTTVVGVGVGLFLVLGPLRSPDDHADIVVGESGRSCGIFERSGVLSEAVVEETDVT